jgi:hypothetical protein
VNKFINYALNPQTLARLTPEKQKEFSERLEGNAQWNLFLKSLSADGQRIKEAGAWQSGVIAWANALALDGEKPAAATDKAFRQLVGDNLGFPMVHGQPTIVNKVRPDGTARTDAEVNDYGRRMQMTLRDIPVQNIKTRDDNGTPYFLTLPQLPESDPKYQQHLRDIITSTGFFRPEPDGQSVSVYLLDSDGVEFQVRDKNNRPLEIDLDALPEFTRKQYSMFGVGGNFGMGGQDTLKDKPSATYDGAVSGWAPYWKHQKMPIPERLKQPGRFDAKLEAYK